MRLLTLRSPPDTGASIHWTHYIAQADWLCQHHTPPSLSRSKSSMLPECWGVTLKFHFRPFTRSHLSSFESREIAKSTWHLSHNFIIRLAARELQPAFSRWYLQTRGRTRSRLCSGPRVSVFVSPCDFWEPDHDTLLNPLSVHVPRARGDHWCECGRWWDIHNKQSNWSSWGPAIHQFFWVFLRYSSTFCNLLTLTLLMYAPFWCN